MHIKIKSPLPIILKKDLVEFDITNRNGVHFLTAAKFKQIIKPSELKQILEHQVEVKACEPVDSVIPGNPGNTEGPVKVSRGGRWSKKR
jgi:hypothetical protein